MQLVKSMVIFDAKILNHTWTKNDVTGIATKYSLSDKGWINIENVLSDNLFYKDVLFFYC